MKLFLEQFPTFLGQSIKKFGPLCERVFKLKDTHLLIANDDMRGYTYGMKASDVFSYHFYMRSEKMDLYHEIVNCFQSDLGEYTGIRVGRLFPSDYSWYKV